jgi:hypothetical protein
MDKWMSPEEKKADLEFHKNMDLAMPLYAVILVVLILIGLMLVKSHEGLAAWLMLSTLAIFPTYQTVKWCRAGALSKFFSLIGRLQ